MVVALAVVAATVAALVAAAATVAALAAAAATVAALVAAVATVAAMAAAAVVMVAVSVAAALDDHDLGLEEVASDDPEALEVSATPGVSALVSAVEAERSLVHNLLRLENRDCFFFRFRDLE